MNKDQHKRAKQAIKEDMDIQHLDGNTYEVKEKYEVNPVENTCTCPDHEYRNHTCKHILRTVLEIQWETVEPPEDDSTDSGRPEMLSVVYDRIPSSLQSMNHWVAWRLEADDVETHEKDWTKVPVNVETGSYASSTNDATWTAFNNAKMYDKRDDTNTDGIGFCVGHDDALIGIDIDDCRDPDSGELVEGVADLVDSIGSYTEVSPSGTGLRIFVFGEWPLDKNQSDLIAGAGTELEVYEWGRYLTVTGYHVEGTPEDVTFDQDTIDTFASIMDTSYTPEA